MNLSERDRRALILMACALVVAGLLRFVVFSDAAPSTELTTDNTALAQQRLVRLRQIAATAPAREASLKQATAGLAAREGEMIPGQTVAQAQASLLEIARRIGKTEQLDVRSGDFGAPRAFGDYGLVYITVTFECHIEQLVNFLSAMTREPALLVPSEERIALANPKEKTMTVRMQLAGVVPKKLIPEKKGLAAF